MNRPYSPAALPPTLPAVGANRFVRGGIPGAEFLVGEWKMVGGVLQETKNRFYQLLRLSYISTANQKTKSCSTIVD